MRRDGPLLAALVMAAALLAAGCASPAHEAPSGTSATGQVVATHSATRAPATSASTSNGPEPYTWDASNVTFNVTAPAPVPPQPPYERSPRVTVATFDTGANPYHPAWRSTRDIRTDVPWFPNHTAIRLTLSDSWEEDRKAMAAELAPMKGAGLFLFEGTRLLAMGDPADPNLVFDPSGEDNSHGAPASSQVAGTGYAIADHAHVVALDHTGGAESYESFLTSHVDWLIEQEWIDVVHINFGFPAPTVGGSPSSNVAKLVAAGKMVVLPALNGAGNGGAPYPMELGQATHARGSLVAGANDQCALGAYWSNLDPHVVMDGVGTVAGEAVGYGDTYFGGTSSSSPRTAGYVAEVLYQVRLAHGLTDGMRDGALVVLPEDTARPSAGPLADGRLTNAELHEAVRKTARPAHDSWLDGGAFASPCPGPVDAGQATYAKQGYGEVSDATLPDAVAVVMGEMPMPARPEEDAMYERSESLRSE